MRRGMADAVIEGKASVPTVAVGEDEFVELDEGGQPKKEGCAWPTASAGHGAQEGPGAAPAGAREGA